MNEPEIIMELANAALGEATFEIAQGDTFFIPFGEYPHRAGMQLFDRAAAEAMLASHNSLISKIKRWAGGGSYPVYIGHPDLPGSNDLDKRAYGWIEGMAIEPDGLRLSVKWSAAGHDLLANAHFKYYSPFWWLKKSGKGFRPQALKSMGLTNDPNIPVPALANESDPSDPSDETPDETKLENTNDNTMTPEILAALGLQEGCATEDILAAIAKLKAAAADAENARACAEDERKKASNTAAAELAAAASELAAVTATAVSDAAVAASNVEYSTGGILCQDTGICDVTIAAGPSYDDLAAAEANLAAANDRLAVAVAHAVAGAVAAGRLAPAETEAKAAELLGANDLSAALQALRELPAKVKTESATGDLGTAKARLVAAHNDDAAAAREDRRIAVANEFAAVNAALPEGERKRIAWDRAQRKHPELFKISRVGSVTAG